MARVKDLAVLVTANSENISLKQYIENGFVQPSINIAALDIDWSLGYIFRKSISANSTFTFSNMEDGKVITVMIKNTSGAAVTIAFPSGIWRDPAMVLSIPAGQKNVYTFIRDNAETTASFIPGMTNV
jgi:hypothetical protein